MRTELVARIRYHVEKAKFCGLKDAESTLLLTEAADAIEELSAEVDALIHDIARYVQINTDLLNATANEMED